MAWAKISAPGPTKLFLLGGFRLERDGTEVSLPRRKVEALLAYLTLYPQEHPREKLAALFWGDSTDADARLSLRVALANLRSALGENLLLADRETVQLNPAFPLWCDARAVKQACEQIGHEKEAASASAITLALELYRGELLPALYDDWALSARTELQELYIRTLLFLIQTARTAADYPSAITYARRVLEADKTNETAHQQLMFAYAMSGERNAALKQYQEAAAILRTELGVEPAPGTEELYRRIKNSPTAFVALTARQTNLPLPLTSFIGREAVLDAFQETLATTRLLTLTGPGGCGKTRLAIELGRRVLERYADGVWWIDLASTNDSSGVGEAVLRTLAVQTSPRVSTTDSIISHLVTKQALLVLDNCEHLVEACAILAETLLTYCPQVQILATSREVLNISGEIGWLVPPLSAPRAEHGELLTAEAVAASESVQLFLERARAARPDFTLTTENANAVAEICAKLDGIPLALELAAARVRGMSVHDIANHLDDRFRLLSGGSRASLPRQQTLRALMDWSYNLLTENERLVLRRSAVLVGTWSIDVAGGIFFRDEEQNADCDLWQLLPRLVDKSLLMLEETDHRTAYRMLDTIRQYAQERLHEAGEETLLYDSHLRYFLARAREAHPKFFTEGQIDAWHGLQGFAENLRAALDWALLQSLPEGERLQNGIELAIALYPFWIMEGDFVEGIRWLGLAGEKARAQFPGLYARALYSAGVLYVNFVDRVSAYPLLQESARAFRALGDETNAARAELYLAFREFEQQRRARAEAMWENVLRVLRAEGDEWNVARTLGWQGRAARYAGEYRRAHELYAESVELFRRVGDSYMGAWSLNMLGTAAYLDGDLETAEQSLRESAGFSRQHNLRKIMGAAYFRLGLVMWSRRDTARSEEYWKESLRSLLEISALHDVGEDLASLALVAEQKEKWLDAARLWGAASVGGITSPYHDRVREPDAYEASMARVRAALGQGAYAEAWQEGESMPPVEAIHLALGI